MNSQNTKATLLILGIVVGLLAIITIPIIISTKRNEEKKYFPDYEKIEINETVVKDVSSDSYKEIKRKLEKDYYFAKEAMISNFDSNHYVSSDLQQMLWNFIFSYSLTNRKYMSSYDEKTGRFCMRSKYVIDAFQELYGVNITKDVDNIGSHINYVTKKGKKYCFSFANIAKDYNNDITIGIDGISVRDNVVTTNLYLYEYYTMYTDSEKYYINQLKSYILSSNYNEANNIVKNNLNGKVTHKQLQFKILENGKHFKYQILVSKILDY